MSLFTLHALWPFLWIWAMAYRPERGWGFSQPSAAGGRGAGGANKNEMEDLRRRVAELENSREREADNGTPADPDLRLDLLRDLQGVQDSGQPVVARDRDVGRDHRHRVAAADHELQSSVHEKCPHLFRGDARAAVGEGPRDRGAGAGEHAAQGR